MSLNFSPLQQYCLDAMGIERWQLREIPVEEVESTVAESNKVAEPVQSYQQQDLANADIDPKLTAQLLLALDYCQQHNQLEIDWNVIDDANVVSLDDNLLKLPPLDKLFANAVLKRQLWSVLSKTQ